MKKEHIDKFYKKDEKDEKDKCKLMFPLSIIYKHLYNQGESILQAECDLRHSEVEVLAAILLNDRVMSPTDLFEVMVFSSGGMTKVLKKLENKDLISRELSKDDKRSMLVKIEPKGMDLVQKCLGLLTQKDSDFFNILDPNEKVFLQQIFKKLLYSLLENPNVKDQK